MRCGGHWTAESNMMVRWLDGRLRLLRAVSAWGLGAVGPLTTLIKECYVIVSYIELVALIHDWVNSLCWHALSWRSNPRFHNKSAEYANNLWFIATHLCIIAIVGHQIIDLHITTFVLWFVRYFLICNISMHLLSTVLYTYH